MGIGLDNPLHIAIVLLVILLLFGAKRLPELGKSLGEGMRGFKDSVTGADTSHHVAEVTAAPPAPPAPPLVAEPVATQPRAAEPVGTAHDRS
jgi:sec-independent protein translocase protein TatA